VVLAKLVVDIGKPGLAIGRVGAFPIKAKALKADGAIDVGGYLGRGAQNLHKDSS
jgi:hypothetical protein